jgi:hypothetical protein
LYLAAAIVAFNDGLLAISQQNYPGLYADEKQNIKDTEDMLKAAKKE